MACSKNASPFKGHLFYYRSIIADLYLSWHKTQNSKILPFHFLKNVHLFFICKKATADNQHDRIHDMKFWHLFLKSLPSISILKELLSRMRYNIEIKTLFLLCFIPRYSNLEVNNLEPELRDMQQFQDLFFMLKRSSFCISFLICVTVPLRFGNIWHFCIILLMSNRKKIIQKIFFESRQQILLHRSQ